MSQAVETKIIDDFDTRIKAIFPETRPIEEQRMRIDKIIEKCFENTFNNENINEKPSLFDAKTTQAISIRGYGPVEKLPLIS